MVSICLVFFSFKIYMLFSVLKEKCRELVCFHHCYPSVNIVHISLFSLSSFHAFIFILLICSGSIYFKMCVYVCEMKIDDERVSHQLFCYCVHSLKNLIGNIHTFVSSRPYIFRV